MIDPLGGASIFFALKAVFWGDERMDTGNYSTHIHTAKIGILAKINYTVISYIVCRIFDWNEYDYPYGHKW